MRCLSCCWRLGAIVLLKLSSVCVRRVSRSQLLWEPSLTHRMSSASGFSVQPHIKSATSYLAANPMLRSRVDDSIVHAASSSAQSIALPETVKLDPRVCEEQGESLMQRIAAKERSNKQGDGCGRRGLRREPSVARARTDFLVICCTHLASWALLDKFYRDFAELPDHLQKQHRDLMLERLYSSSSSTLASSCSALSRWTAWACGQGIDPFLVAPLRVALWLRSLSLEFPYFLPQLPFSALRWLETH